MKHKVAELEGALLDFAVARIERGDVESNRDFTFWLRELWETGAQRYSMYWAIGGPILERERINVVSPRPGYWAATPHDVTWDPIKQQSGPTPLIAAMRAYVASKLGDEVEFEEPGYAGAPPAEAA